MGHTTPEIQRIHDTMMRKLSPQERFRRGLALTRLSRKMLIAGIMAKNPSLSEQELRRKLMKTLYGVGCPASREPTKTPGSRS